jgi:hypothetical protein
MVLVAVQNLGTLLAYFIACKYVLSPKCPALGILFDGEKYSQKIKTSRNFNPPTIVKSAKIGFLK